MSSNYEKFLDLLRELFQMDQADLDFGIYRIMNAKRDEIDAYLKDDLLPQVKEILEATVDSKGKEELDTAVKNARDLGMDPDTVPRVQELRTKYGSSMDITTLENEVFSHLYSFFRRYYKDGDFISQRRYKKDVYAIPYEGEEVKLYWANYDQYYIKTAENFKDYSFKLESGRRVHFRLIDASTEQDNKKEISGKERRFIIREIDTIAEEDGELVIRFEYREDEENRKQDALNTAAVEKIFGMTAFMDWLGELGKKSPTTKKPDRTVLEKHLTTYTARNTFDYFIHKNLDVFLSRELDFYIKNEVMHLDDIENETATGVEQYLAVLKAIRRIAKKVIRFLTQIENFQKKMWLKKKFVVETNYCITLDRVPEELYPEIIKNEEQIDEWIKLFAINNIEGDLISLGYTKPLQFDFLKANNKLVLDTRFFNVYFKTKLLNSIDNLGNHCQGLLINSENFQALALIQRLFEKKVHISYIDPPFNLGENADYLYKVDYRDSTWMSLLKDRLVVANKIISQTGSSMVRCNHDGNMLIRMLMNEIFGTDNYRNEIIIRRAEESKGDLNKQFAGMRSITVNYDNLYWYSIEHSARFNRFLKPTTTKQGKSHWHSFWKAENRPNLRYEILGIDLSKHYGQWMWSKERALRAVENYNIYLKEKECTGISLDEYWERNKENYYEENFFTLEFIGRFGDSYSSIKYWIPPREYVMADNNWLDIKGYANKWSFKTENSEVLLKRIIESLTDVNDLVLDYFVGSGTSAATSQKLGRCWIAIEMGDHFENVVLNRLKLVLNGENSGISREVNWQGGGFFKYIRLESYEDTLNNIELKRIPEQENALDLFGKQGREDYLLSYMLDMETKDSASLLNIEMFRDPFNYKLKITRNNETKQTPVDLLETFNYLIGLHVKHIDNIRGIYVVDGTNREGERILVLWRNVDKTDNAALDAWFTKQGYNTRDQEYDIVYVNGDNNLENLRRSDQTWKVRMIEPEFKRLMFEVEDV